MATHKKKMHMFGGGNMARAPKQQGEESERFGEELISIAPSSIIHEMPFGSTAQSC